MAHVSPFTIEVNRWYSWQMLPGYGDGFVPYLSPILVRRIDLLKTGKGELELVFFNALYAQGVQDFKQRLKVLTRRSNHLIAASADTGDLGRRDLVIGSMSFEWLNRFLPEWYAERPKNSGIHDSPLDSEKYLSLRFFGTEYPWRTSTHA